MNRDEIYLNYFGNILNSGGHARFSYLQFLVSINIAIYAAIYYLSFPGCPYVDNFWSPIPHAKLGVILLLIFVNIIFTFKYFRDHCLAEVREEEFLAYLKTGWEGSGGGAIFYCQNRIKEKDKMRGLDWEATKILFSLFNAIPIGFLSNLPFQCLGAFILFLLIWAFIIWLILTCKEYKRCNS